MEVFLFFILIIFGIPAALGGITYFLAWRVEQALKEEK